MSIYKLKKNKGYLYNLYTLYFFINYLSEVCFFHIPHLLFESAVYLKKHPLPLNVYIYYHLLYIYYFITDK
uniref:Uncharacterized protein n=1 Tax=Myoviridae sp. ctXXl13 TaxID=2827691 RepID=A0A8S5TIV9_9CAUD|nr:MAG TPA: hypothetical protein [Myoviridae sp. ctXXl13]